MDEDQNTGESQEQTPQEQFSNTPDLSAELAAMKAELESLKTQQFQAQSPMKEPEPQLTAEQAQALRDNPDLLAKWLKAQADQAKNEIKKESSKQIWDTRTYEKFPLLKTDKEFSKKVTAQMREMITQGEYGKDDPMLLYRAAQIAAAEYAVTNKSFNRSPQSASSVEPRNSNRSAEVSKPKIDNNDPRMKFAEVLGITGAKLEKFRAQLGPYTPSNRRQARRLSK